MGSDTMSMIKAIEAGIAECASRDMAPTDLLLTSDSSQRLLRELIGMKLTEMKYADTELGKIFGLRIVTNSNLPERYALLQHWKAPIRPYEMTAFQPVIVGVVDFGDA